MALDIIIKLMILTCYLTMFHLFPTDLVCFKMERTSFTVHLELIIILIVLRQDVACYLIEIMNNY